MEVFRLIFDMTDYKSNLKSLVEFLDLTEEDISDFVFLDNSDEKDVLDFLEAFNIEDEKLLEKDIELVSLHSTTSIDNCSSIKEKGISNLQDAVTQETPLKAYLDLQDIQINVVEKYILYKGNKLDISEKKQGYVLSDEDENRNRVIHKLYVDFQINGFLSHENALTYEGNTRDRPEILYDLAMYLKNKRIADDWIKDESKQHFIIKFKQPLHYYRYFTFHADFEDSPYGITKDNLEYLPHEVLEVKVKKWLINESINIIRNGTHELCSFVNPKVKIEPKDIIDIMEEQEYLNKYEIDNND